MPAGQAKSVAQTLMKVHPRLETKALVMRLCLYVSVDISGEGVGRQPRPPEALASHPVPVHSRCTTSSRSCSLPAVGQQAAQPRRASSTPAVRQACASSVPDKSSRSDLAEGPSEAGDARQRH